MNLNPHRCGERDAAKRENRALNNSHRRLMVFILIYKNEKWKFP
jgi:hypothetical protein